MASQLQTSCRASWWTIGVCILAAALLPGELVPPGGGGHCRAAGVCVGGVCWGSPGGGLRGVRGGKGCGKCRGAVAKEEIGFLGCAPASGAGVGASA